MKVRFIIFSMLLIALSSAATAYYWPNLPESIPMHWNLAGEVDRYDSRWLLWLVGPGLIAFIMLLALLVPYLSPRRFGISTFESTYWYMMAVTLAMPAYAYALLLISATGGQVLMSRAIIAGFFVMMILIGNPAGKVRKNFYLGIRTPWTLSSERVWYATHRLAARLMVASGVLGIISLLLNASVLVLLIFLFCWIPVVVTFSLLHYKRLEKAGALD